VDDLTLIFTRYTEARAQLAQSRLGELLRARGPALLRLVASYALVGLGAHAASWSNLFALVCAIGAIKIAGARWPSASAIILGLIWGRDTWLVGFAPLVIAAWWWSSSRLEACAVGTLYHFAAARDTVPGAAHYLELPLVVGFAVVAACALLIGAVWAACWSPRLRDEAAVRAAARLAALLLTSQLPPIGMLAVASPLCAAGSWFAGLGWFGLGLTFGVLLLSRVRWGAAVIVALACIGAANPPPAAPRGFVGVSTDLEPARGLEDFPGQLRVADRSIDAAAAAAVQGGQVFVLPESAGGLWQQAMRRVWAPFGGELEQRQQTALVGVAVPRRDGGWDNAVVGLGAWRGTYRQRVPVPVAMWRPWAPRESFAAHWFGPGVVDVPGARVGLLVCWEAGLAWPALQSVAEGAEALVAVSNLGWFAGRGVWGAQRQTLESWGALFGLPVLLVANVEGGFDV
jgi:apolipoprotein N-acyltransferase